MICADCKSKIKILCLPKHKVLSDGGYIWESALFTKGWNDLTEDRQIGEITDAYKVKGAGTLFDIKFNGCGVTVRGVFLDEISLMLSESILCDCLKK